MQITPRYLVNNRVTIVADLAGSITEYRPVYQRHLQVYRGIDNTLQFKILNSDQKPVSLSEYNVKLTAFDENKTLVLEKEGTVSSSITGLVEVVISDNDLLNVKDQFLTYSLHLVDSTTLETVLTYSDTHFGACGIIDISSCVYPGPKNSYEVFQFSEEDGLSGIEDSVWCSESITAEPSKNGNEALHTAVIYTNNYSGDVVVQATLDNQVTGTTSWADITTVSFTGSETEPTPVNFNGVYSYLRFKTSQNPTDKISKILVRN